MAVIRIVTRSQSPTNHRIPCVTSSTRWSSESRSVGSPIDDRDPRVGREIAGGTRASGEHRRLEHVEVRRIDARDIHLPELCAPSELYSAIVRPLRAAS
jgi:hypothetical protein